MNAKNMQKLEDAKAVFENKGILFRELPNGQLQVDGINFWATSEKWHDPKKDVKGQGINSFIKYLKEQNVI